MIRGKAAIYHFTDNSEKRPIINEKQLELLKEYAASIGYTDVTVYCDKSLCRCDRIEFDHFLTQSEKYEALITKDYYHIAKNTAKCMPIMKELKDKGLSIYTKENGNLVLKEPPLAAPLRVATYCCRFGAPEQIKTILSVQNDILRLFADKQTSWTVIEQYSDISASQKEGERYELMKLLEKKKSTTFCLCISLKIFIGGHQVSVESESSADWIYTHYRKGF